jgi:hypothetical protein
VVKIFADNIPGSLSLPMPGAEFEPLTLALRVQCSATVQLGDNLEGVAVCLSSNDIDHGYHTLTEHCMH